MSRPFPMPKRRKLIAIIDDDAQVRRALDRLLRAFLFDVQSYESADHFLAAAPDCGADCLILDIDLGATSGLRLACHPTVAALNRPIIFMSGSLGELRADQTLDLGGVAFLRKPFKASELLAAIDKVQLDASE